MARPRMPHTPLIGVKVTQATRARLDELLRQHRKQTGDEYTISRFVREAIEEKLTREEKLSPKARDAIRATG